RQGLGLHAGANRLAGVDEALEPGLGRLHRRQGLGAAPEAGQVGGVLLGGNAVLGLQAARLGALEVEQGGLEIGVGGDARHHIIPSRTSYMSEAAWIIRAEALNACW